MGRENSEGIVNITSETSEQKLVIKDTSPEYDWITEVFLRNLF